MLENKAILEKTNRAITKGDKEGFLEHCTEDTEWHFVGERILRGKEAVREYMKTAYIEPPKFTVTNMIAEGDYVSAIGIIQIKNEEGKEIEHLYCDVWKFRDGKMAELKAFVIPAKIEDPK